jgi:hypothetical protein
MGGDGGKQIRRKRTKSRWLETVNSEFRAGSAPLGPKHGVQVNSGRVDLSEESTFMLTAAAVHHGTSTFRTARLFTKLASNHQGCKEFARQMLDKSFLLHPPLILLFLLILNQLINLEPPHRNTRRSILQCSLAETSIGGLVVRRAWNGTS